MAVRYASFSRRTRSKLRELSPANLTTLATWSAEGLDRAYGAHLDELGHTASRDVLRAAIDAAWTFAGTPADKARIADHLTYVRDIDIDDLDFAVPRDCGVLKLMEATEAALALAIAEDDDLVGLALTALWAPIDVLNVLKDGGALRPDVDSLDHPFFAGELAAQDATIADLRGGLTIDRDSRRER